MTMALFTPIHVLEDAAKSLGIHLRGVSGPMTGNGDGPVSTDFWKINTYLTPCSELDCWHLIQKRCIHIAHSYLWDGYQPSARRTIPVAPALLSDASKASAGSQSSSGASTHILRCCLEYIEFFTSCGDDLGWISKHPVPAKDLNNILMTPQLLVRSDATKCQMNSIAQLFCMDVFSLQLNDEIKSERMVEIFIRTILDEASGHLVMAPLCAPDKCSAPDGIVCPLTVVIFENSMTEESHRNAARKQMARLLHKSLVLLVMRHYCSQGWKYDRKLTDADVTVAMDARLFIYGIFYSRTEFTVCSHHPQPAKQQDGTYRWMFENTRWISLPWDMPLVHTSRMVLLDAMLALEQHEYELTHLLYNM